MRYLKQGMMRLKSEKASRCEQGDRIEAFLEKKAGYVSNYFAMHKVKHRSLRLRALSQLEPELVDRSLRPLGARVPTMPTQTDPQIVGCQVDPAVHQTQALRQQSLFSPHRV